MLDALELDYAGHFELAMEIYQIAKEQSDKQNAHVA